MHINVFAKFHEIPLMILQDVKETKRYGHTFGRSVGRTDVKTVYPPTNTVCGGYNKSLHYLKNQTVKCVYKILKPVYRWDIGVSVQ